MKNILIGIAVCLVVFLVCDYIYAGTNTCQVVLHANSPQVTYKCGIIYNTSGYVIDALGRYW